MSYKEWYEKYVGSRNQPKIVKETKFDDKTMKILEKEFGKLSTSKVVLFKERVEHIISRHPEVEKSLFENFENIINEFNYILKDMKNDNTVWLIKKIKNNDRVNVIIKLGIDYRQINSVITSYCISQKQLERYIRKNRVILDNYIK